MTGRKKWLTLASWLLAGSILAFGCQGELIDQHSQRSNSLGTLDAGDAEVSRDSAAFTDGNTSCGSANCPDNEAGHQAACGDGHRDPGEQCDDGNIESDDGCDSECDTELIAPAVVCGDGVFDIDEEECDDGNQQPGDGCDRQCRGERCGNERRDEGEDCDPPAAGECDATCRAILPNCGDGEIQQDEGEDCDDSNDGRGDGCNHCHLECGDDRLERDIGEECEPKYAVTGSCDDDTCKRLPLCGDGRIDEAAGEDCDPSDGVTCVNCKFSLDAGPDGGSPDAPACSSSLSQVAVTNGKFETDVSGWLPGSGAVTATHQSEGAHETGSIEVTYAAGSLPNASTDGVTQCVPVPGNAHFDLVLQYYNPASNPVDVLPAVSIKLYASTTCDGSFTSGSGPPVSSARDTWVSFVRPIDTSSLGATPGSLWIKLSPIAPAGVASATMRFDDVALGSCGNCVVEAEVGETCDDGNTTAGDGCSATCQFECGNHTVESPEQCDDGNFTFGDSCTPSCRSMTTCDTCANTQCTDEVDACLGLEGVAELGPRQGMARSALCSRLRDCIHDSGCNLDTAIAYRPNLGGEPADPTHPGVPENCYCGTSGLDCLQEGAANGSCRAEIEAALETDDPYQIIQRVGGTHADYLAFAATTNLLACESTQCSSPCSKTISCGDGLVEDRTNAFAGTFNFVIDRIPTLCADIYTHTGLGCSFEECDDGNTLDDDGCDSDCFVEACGNYLKQGIEECDDGNLEDGDGCDSDCIAEFVCGDDEVTDPFEECEPPGTGTVCSLEDYATDPATCGCDSACLYKVCGNEVVQEGEECDPPNGLTCDDTCHRDVDPCTECLLQIAPGQYCDAETWFNGSENPADIFAVGCLEDEACSNLWECERETLCFSDPYSIANCYCGLNADLTACEGASYVPTGPCKNEIRAAFNAQWGRDPVNNLEMLTSFVRVSDNPYNPLTTSTLIATVCMVPDSNSLGDPTLRQQLTDSGLGPDEVTACMNACFPP